MGGGLNWIASMTNSKVWVLVVLNAAIY